MLHLVYCCILFCYVFECLQILMDPGIHSNLVTFVALLVANGCFLLSDIISYILKPIIRIQLMHPQGILQWQFLVHHVNSLFSLPSFSHLSLPLSLLPSSLPPSFPPSLPLSLPPSLPPEDVEWSGREEGGGGKGVGALL